MRRSPSMLRLGLPTSLLVTILLAASASAQVPIYLGMWGSFGTGSGQFKTPVGVAVSSSGAVYVADSNLPRIQVFTTSGLYVSQWGSEGTGPGQFTTGTTGIAVDAA